MPTEEIFVANSQLEAHNGGFEGARIRRDFLGKSEVAICIAVRDALIAAGWEEAGTTKASWSLVLPFGLPTTEPPDVEVEDKPPVTGGANPVTIDGIRYFFYDPFRVLPVEDPTVIWIPMSTTVEGSIENLVDAIDNDGVWYSTGWRVESAYPFTNWVHVDFEAIEGGLESNGAAYGGESDVQSSIGSIWYWAFLSPVGVAGGPFGHVPAGGGVFLRSYQSETDYLQVWIGFRATGAHSASFHFSTSREDRGQPVYTLPHSPTAEYRVLANQFQFFVWQTVGGTAQLMASYPRMATFRGVEYAAVVGDNWRTEFQWTSAYSAANSGLVRSQGWLDPGNVAARQPGLYCFKNPGFAYRSIDGKAIAQTAYLGCPPNEAVEGYDGEARIVGVLWDALLVQGLYDLGAELMIDGIAYECIARQDGGSLAAHATLWVAF